MAKRIKKLMCLLLTVAMVATLFVGCGNSGKTTETPRNLKPFDDETTMTLSYMYWEDQYITDSLELGWAEKHPNATLKETMSTTGDINSTIQNLIASRTVPDVFWVLGSPEAFINKGILMDMSPMWENDPDTADGKLIGGVNEFKLGYFGTAGKWTTPVKFFPTVMFLNVTTFKVLNHELPDYDWSWEDLEEVVADMSHDKYFGMSAPAGAKPITLYPIASDPNCIGEFGWNGTEFDLTQWAEGMEITKEWIDRKYLAPVPGGDTYGTGVEDDMILSLYGSSVQPQDEGYAAIRTDQWWCWERYWNDSGFYEKNTFFVPYTVPHTSDNEKKTAFATIDFGAISAMSEHPLEAYYLLKYMTWGAEGWNWRLDHYDEIRAAAVEAGGGNPDETTGGETINNCPITKDSEVWAKYKKLHPNSETGDPIEDKLVAAGLKGTERIDAFNAFWDNVLEANWVCYGSQQIPGFDTWLKDTYQNKQFVEGYTGIEPGCFQGDGNPSEFVKELTDSANESANEYKNILNNRLK